MTNDGWPDYTEYIFITSCVHHKSLPTMKSKHRNIGSIKYISEKLGRVLEPGPSDIASSRTTILLIQQSRF